MIPVYTYVYPFKAQDEAEAPQIRGQCTAVAPPGYTRQNGGFHGLGLLDPWDLAWAGPLVGGYALTEGCAAGYLPSSVCDAAAMPTPGRTMPGSCPPAYQVDGACVCPKGGELPDGGCTYEPGFTVDANGALPIGGSPTPPAPAAIDTTWLWLGAAVAGGLGYYLYTQK